MGLNIMYIRVRLFQEFVAQRVSQSTVNSHSRRQSLLDDVERSSRCLTCLHR